MKGKFITGQQSSHVGGVLTGLVAGLDKSGFQWTKQHRQDLEIAFKAIGHPMPFAFADLKPGEKPNNVAQAPGLGKRIKALITSHG